MRAPNFKLPYLLKNEEFELIQHLGERPLIITFWVSWCPDCSTDLPKKEQLYKTMNGQIGMITINVTGRERNEGDAAKFAEKFLEQDVLKDRNREVYDAFKCDGVPTTIIIGKNGDIVANFDDQADFIDIVGAVGEALKA